AYCSRAGVNSTTSMFSSCTPARRGRSSKGYLLERVGTPKPDDGTSWFNEAMDVAWLESLLALTEHGSFSRAADALHVSQPAFSRRIRSLEQWIGAELVDRSTYPVSLTPAGVKLHRQAASVMS